MAESSERTVRPDELFFTQDTIPLTFSKPRDHERIDDTVDLILEGKLSPKAFPKLNVVEFQDRLWSLDNRRLWVFKKAEVRVVTVTVVEYDFHSSTLMSSSSPYSHGSPMSRTDFFPRVRGNCRETFSSGDFACLPQTPPIARGRYPKSALSFPSAPQSPSGHLERLFAFESPSANASGRVMRGQAHRRPTYDPPSPPRRAPDVRRNLETSTTAAAARYSACQDYSRRRNFSPKKSTSPPESLFGAPDLSLSEVECSRVGVPSLRRKRQVEAPVDSRKRQVEAPLGSRKRQVEAPVESRKRQVDAPVWSRKRQVEAPLGSRKRQDEAPRESRKRQVDSQYQFQLDAFNESKNYYSQPSVKKTSSKVQAAPPASKVRDANTSLSSPPSSGSDCRVPAPASAKRSKTPGRKSSNSKPKPFSYDFHWKKHKAPKTPRDRKLSTGSLNPEHHHPPCSLRKQPISRCDTPSSWRNSNLSTKECAREIPRETSARWHGSNLLAKEHARELQASRNKDTRQSPERKARREAQVPFRSIPKPSGKHNKHSFEPPTIGSKARGLTKRSSTKWQDDSSFQTPPSKLPRIYSQANNYEFVPLQESRRGCGPPTSRLHSEQMVRAEIGSNVDQRYRPTRAKIASTEKDGNGRQRRDQGGDGDSSSPQREIPRARSYKKFSPATSDEQTRQFSRSLKKQSVGIADLETDRVRDIRRTSTSTRHARVLEMEERLCDRSFRKPVVNTENQETDGFRHECTTSSKRALVKSQGIMNLERESSEEFQFETEPMVDCPVQYDSTLDELLESTSKFLAKPFPICSGSAKFDYLGDDFSKLEHNQEKCCSERYQSEQESPRPGRALVKFGDCPYRDQSPTGLGIRQLNTVEDLTKAGPHMEVIGFNRGGSHITAHTSGRYAERAWEDTSPTRPTTRSCTAYKRVRHKLKSTSSSSKQVSRAGSIGANAVVPFDSAGIGSKVLLPGDMVYVEMEETNFDCTPSELGFRARVMGPFRVHRKVNKFAARLELPADCDIHPIFSLKLLKDSPSPLDILVHPNGIPVNLVAETILRKRVTKRLRRRKVFNYLVKWEHLPTSEATWEPETVLDLYPHLLDQTDSPVFSNPYLLRNLRA